MAEPEIEDDVSEEKEASEEEATEKRRRSTIVDQLAEQIGDGDSVTNIVVCDPEEHSSNKGLTKWVDYKVITSRADGTNDEVTRRYKHFLWLRTLLLKDCKGSIVPPLPEKQNFGRFEASFIERRRRRLEVFLNRVVEHSDLRQSNALRVFLSIQETDMFDQALAGDSSTVSEKASSLYNSYRKQKQRVIQSVSSSYEPTPDDVECSRIKAYGTNLEKIARQLEQCFLNLDNDLRAQGMLWVNTADNLALLGDFEQEEENERDANALKAFEETCRTVSTLAENPESISTFTTIKLRDLFDDVSKYGTAVRECCEGRDEVFYQHCAEVSTLESNVAKVEALETARYTYNREQRIEDTKKAIEEAEIAAAESEARLGEVTKKLQSEFSDFQSTKPNRIEERVQNFADYQIEHLTEMVKYWQDLKDRLSSD